MKKQETTVTDIFQQKLEVRMQQLLEVVASKILLFVHFQLTLYEMRPLTMTMAEVQNYWFLLHLKVSVSFAESDISKDEDENGLI
jgi:hypothetical protein